MGTISPNIHDLAERELTPDQLCSSMLRERMWHGDIKGVMPHSYRNPAESEGWNEPCPSGSRQVNATKLEGCFRKQLACTSKWGR